MLLTFINLSSSLNLSLLQHFIEVPYATHPRPMHKTGLIIFIACSFLTLALAATDCEILNSGMSSISSTACCTETSGIVCVNDRVTEMLGFYAFNSISDIDGVDFEGHLPLAIGNLTELIEIDIEYTDLSAGPVPDSIGLCTKLVKVRFSNCKLQGEFPVGLRDLKSLHYLSLWRNNFSGNIPAWIGILNQLKTIDLTYNEFSGELPIEICDLIILKVLKIFENSIEGMNIYCLLTLRHNTHMHWSSHKFVVP
jgi:Leucine-rich repeat (LRR) protein